MHEVRFVTLVNLLMLSVDFWLPERIPRMSCKITKHFDRFILDVSVMESQ